MTQPLLIVFGGLPGVGKSTLAKALAQHLTAVYLRVDTIEQAIRDKFGTSLDVGEAGYMVSYGLATDNLKLGLSVVADQVNPISITRDTWLKVASDNTATHIGVEVYCSDTNEHKDRVESRVSDINKLILPTWNDILNHSYEPWSDAEIRIDTANKPITEAARELFAVIDIHRNS